MKRIHYMLVIILVLAAAGAGLYLFLNKKVEDKASQMPPPAGPGATAESAKEALEKKRLNDTLRTLEETRKMNEMNNPHKLPHQDPTANVRKTLDTINDINRINKLNRDLRNNKKP